jgi:hypothetical protein
MAPIVGSLIGYRIIFFPHQPWTYLLVAVMLAENPDTFQYIKNLPRHKISALKIGHIWGKNKVW